MEDLGPPDWGVAVQWVRPQLPRRSLAVAWGPSGCRAPRLRGAALTRTRAPDEIVVEFFFREVLRCLRRGARHEVPATRRPRRGACDAVPTTTQRCCFAEGKFNGRNCNLCFSDELISKEEFGFWSQRFIMISIDIWAADAQSIRAPRRSGTPGESQLSPSPVPTTWHSAISSTHDTACSPQSR